MFFLFTSFDFFFRNFSEELSRKNEMDFSGECCLNYSLRCQYIFSLIWFNLSFSWWKKKQKGKEEKWKKKNPGNQNPCHSLFSCGNHLRSTSGIICCSGLFAVQFGDHFRSGDHLRSGIICSAVQLSSWACDPFGKVKWNSTLSEITRHLYFDFVILK